MKRCGYSWLLPDHCAHCLNQKLDPELEEVAAANIQQGQVSYP